MATVGKVKTKYDYLFLLVNGKRFRTYEMRAAVAYLKRVANTKHVGLQAPITIRNERIWLYADPMITLDEIIGKTPRQVWAWFDHGG